MDDLCSVPVGNARHAKAGTDPFLSYYTLVSQTPFAVVLLRGPEFLIEVTNQHALALWGKKSEEVMNKTLIEAFPELVPQGFLDILHNVYSTGQRFVANEQPVTLVRNGQPETVYINFSYDPLRDEGGQIVGILGVGNDVTELVVARQKEKETETTLRNLLAQTPTPLFILRGEDLVLEIANQSLFELWGTDESAIGKPFLEILPEMKNQGFYDLLLQVLHTGEAYYGNETAATFIRPDGREFTHYFDFIYQPYRENDGRITGIIVLAKDVTEQVTAKKKLEESERNFRNMIVHAPIAMCVLRGPELTVDIANGRMFELWGKPEFQMLGQPLFTGLHEARGQGLEQVLAKVYATGKRYHENERPVDLPRNGTIETTYINFVYEPLREDGVNVTGIMAVAIDVTTQVRARQQIEAAEERARLAIESADMGTFEVDLRSDSIITSPRLDVIFGVKAGSSRSTYANAILSEDRPHRQKAYQEADRTGVLQYEGRVMWEDGSVHWVKVNGRLYKDEDGKMIKLSGVAQDITERKNFEDTLQAKHEELELVTQVMPQMVWAKNADGYTYFLNKRWVGYTGMKMEELLGWGWMDALHPDDYERVKTLWADAIRAGEAYSTEYRLRCHRNEYKWFLSKGIPVRDKDQKIIKWYGATTDIHLQKTEAARLEVLVEKRTEELRRSNQELEQFAHVASHDMKEPIRKAKLFVERLQSECGHFLPNNGLLYLQRVKNAADRLTSMVEGVLNYSTINSSLQNVEPVDLASIIHNIETDLELVIVAKGAHIKYESLPQFEGAAFLIYQLFYNLVNNSLKFLVTDRQPEIVVSGVVRQGRELKHLFDAKDNLDYVELKVEDNGIGFSQDHAERIFDTFTRLHSRDEFEGTGMGLALVKRIVDRHHGHVFAQGTPGQGASFTILLPRKQERLD
jgi:PAS domain S-box-containing protein